MEKKFFNASLANGKVIHLMETCVRPSDNAVFKYPICGVFTTARHYHRPTNKDVTCKKCLKMKEKYKI